MALIDTFWGSLALGGIGVALIKVGRVSIRESVAFYGALFRKDPIRTMMFDQLLAALRRPTANPVVWSIMLWILGWGLAILGFANALLGKFD